MDKNPCNPCLKLMLVESEFSELCSLRMRQDDELSEQNLRMEASQLEIRLCAGVHLVNAVLSERLQSLVSFIFCEQV